MVRASMVRSDNACTISELNDSFDVDSAIGGFLADPACAFLELPRLLSAEQRKHTKKVVEAYPGLKCESFGLGKDRRLHLFKSILEEKSFNETSVSEGQVTVKNTFIDDWINVEGSPADHRTVQSMPHNMFGQCLSDELSRQVGISRDGKEPGIAVVNKETTCAVTDTKQEHLFALGAEVVIDGLVKAPAFNGMSGVVQSWDVETARYNVLLASAPVNGQRWAKIKGDNLRYAFPR